MNKSTRWIIGILGTLTILLGIGCLNYTKMGTIEHHGRFAAQYGVPAPSTRIVYLGMLLTPLGAELRAEHVFTLRVRRERVEDGVHGRRHASDDGRSRGRHGDDLVPSGAGEGTLGSVVTTTPPRA